MFKTIAMITLLLAATGLGRMALGAETIPASPPGHQHPTLPEGFPSVSLQAVMQGIAGHYIKLVEGILSENFHQISDAAVAIAHHPMPAPLLLDLRGKLGKKFDGFEHLDHEAHDAAEAIRQAADRKDLPAVVQGNLKLFTICTDCHQLYR